ncbi:GTP-binding protein HflX [Labilithrix luteola]|uniref:GTPase HflX n=1 Tax=Labilithrix luteola TaxID=1391654 RepID=A0A0K1Q710_9BACT|nr:GTP-binding protein HflX [Labilithrix luteola]
METGRQVGALVHRSGQVDYVIVGDSGKLMLPDIGRLRAAEGRFRGLRLIHTHVRGEALTRDDLVDLVRLRLDLVCAIQINARGEARSLHYAYNIPGEEGALPYREHGPTPIGQERVHVGELMSGLEAEFAKRTRGRAVRAPAGRALLVHVADKSERDVARRADESVRELRELARTAGVEVVDTIVQLRERVDPKTVLGKGKLDDVILRSMQLDSDVLIFDRELTPAQASAIAKESDLKVIDRTQLILDIFAQRAESKDGKVQVELAQLKYNMPRLVMKDDSLSRLTGGIGGRGPGETKLEIGRRRAKERVSHLEAQLKKFGRQREQRRHKRTREGVPTVAIVGYTNAGKSTLLNTLTGADVLAEDKLFATLDTRSRHLKVGWAGYGDREVVISDTVGFIRSLPKDLFAAFRATFEEASDADLLLVVVDATDDAKQEHIATTESLLEELGLQDIPRVLVFNKIELLAPIDRALLQRKNPDAVLLSATQRETTRPLVERIAKELAERWTESAKTPETMDLEGQVTPPSEEPAEDADVSASTLVELLRRAGRRVRPPRLVEEKAPRRV